MLSASGIILELTSAPKEIESVVWSPNTILPLAVIDPLTKSEPETLTVPDFPSKGVMLFTFKLLIVFLVCYKY